MNGLMPVPSQRRDSGNIIAEMIKSGLDLCLTVKLLISDPDFLQPPGFTVDIVKLELPMSCCRINLIRSRL